MGKTFLIYRTIYLIRQPTENLMLSDWTTVRPTSGDNLYVYSEYSMRIGQDLKDTENLVRGVDKVQGPLPLVGQRVLAGAPAEQVPAIYVLGFCRLNILRS